MLLLLQGDDSIENVQLEFWLENGLLRFPRLRKQFSHVPESKMNLEPFYELKLKLFFLLNWVPGAAASPRCVTAVAAAAGMAFYARVVVVAAAAWVVRQ